MSAPKIYHYHPTTREYLSEGEADQSPKDDDTWLYPANSTIIKPPTVKEEEVAVWSGTEWTIEPDFRGAIFWFPGDHNLSEGRVQLLIGPLPEDALSEKPDAPAEEWKWPNAGEFFAEFTDEEKLALWKDNGDAALLFRVNLAMFQNVIATTDTWIVEGLDTLVTAKIISSERKIQILS